MSEWHMRRAPEWPSGTAPLAAVFHEIRVPRGLAGDGAQHNPSVLVGDNDSLHVVVRVLHRLASSNFMGLVGDDWTIRDARLIDLRAIAAKARIGQLEWNTGIGLEDIRLFQAGDRMMGSATVQAYGRLRIAVFELDGHHVVSASVQSSERNEKNWMPVQDGKGERFVYSVDPLITLKYDRERKTVNPSATALPHIVDGVIRGGSQLVPFEGGFVAVVHQVHDARAPSRDHNPHMSLLGEHMVPYNELEPCDHHVFYAHRFAYFDAALTRVQLGRPFYFLRRGIEFCAGMAYWRGKYVLSFGAADNCAFLAEVDSATIEAMR